MTTHSLYSIELLNQFPPYPENGLMLGGNLTTELGGGGGGLKPSFSPITSPAVNMLVSFISKTYVLDLVEIASSLNFASPI